MTSGDITGGTSGHTDMSMAGDLAIFITHQSGENAKAGGMDLTVFCSIGECGRLSQSS